MPDPSPPPEPTPTTPPGDPRGFDPLAGVAAVLIPGLGHAVQGQTRRGLHAGVGVLGLFLGGLFVGGIDAVDRREDFIWFMGQALVGPLALGVDYAHQEHFKIRELSPNAPSGVRYRTPNPDEAPRHARSLGKMNEIGTLSCAVAGLMNLILVLDAAFPRASRRRGARA